jgi:hypothetical protein
MTIVVNEFVKRQTPESRFSHFNGTWQELEALVEENWEHASPGYRDGVILIRVPSAKFASCMVELKDGDRLVGEYKPRAKGEQPRKSIGVSSRRKVRAVTTDIVMYSSKALAETDQNSLLPKQDNWEIVSINASSVKGDAPIHPMVLMHNHFGSSGGTATNLSDSDFTDMLRQSFNFWKNKASCA